MCRPEDALVSVQAPARMRPFFSASARIRPGGMLTAYVKALSVRVDQWRGVEKADGSGSVREVLRRVQLGERSEVTAESLFPFALCLSELGKCCPGTEALPIPLRPLSHPFPFPTAGARKGHSPTAAKLSILLCPWSLCVCPRSAPSPLWECSSFSFP